MLFGAAFAHADYIVAVNSTTSLNGGALNLSCTDLIVAGTLNLGSGAILNARNLTVRPGGIVQGGSGFIALSGNWTVSATGQFVAGTSNVHCFKHAARRMHQSAGTDLRRAAPCLHVRHRCRPSD